MKFLKRIYLTILASLSVALAPMHMVAMQNASMPAPVEDAANFIKNIFTLDYLNGDKGQYRNSTLLEKITNQPDRVLATAAVFGLTAFIAKKLYDLAIKYDIFGDSIKDNTHPVPQARSAQTVPRYPQVPVDHAPAFRPAQNPRSNQSYQAPRSQRPNQSWQNSKPSSPAPRPQTVPQQTYQPQTYQSQNNTIRLAERCPLRGNQINMLPHLPGFFHMESHTMYERVNNSCGLQSVYNMARVEAHAQGRDMDHAHFEQVQRELYPQLGGRGTVISGRGGQVGAMARRLGLSRMTVLPDSARQPNLAPLVQEFRNAQGPYVLHFLCRVPNHGVAVSVVKYADGTQAMFLHDNMNHQSPHRDALRRHVEGIYNRFF